MAIATSVGEGSLSSEKHRVWSSEMQGRGADAKVGAKRDAREMWNGFRHTSSHNNKTGSSDHVFGML